MNLNKVYIIGRLTADPELKTTPSGQSVATVRIATNSTWTDKAGKRQESTEFHSVVVWGRQAEIVNQFLKKGSEAMIEGRLQTRNWDDKQGVKHWKTEVVADHVQFGARPGGSAPSGNSAGTGQASGAWSQKSEVPSESQSIPEEEQIPIINMDEPEGEIKAEDLPF